MIAGDEFYPDDVTSGVLDEDDDDREECGLAIEAEWDEGYWHVTLCDELAVAPGKRCAEHAA